MLQDNLGFLRHQLKTHQWFLPQKQLRGVMQMQQKIFLSDSANCYRSTRAFMMKHCAGL